jgi:choline-sulfatase
MRPPFYDTLPVRRSDRSRDATLVLRTNLRRPNILFILVDDQTPLRTESLRPAIDARYAGVGPLAAEGMTLDGAYHMGSFVGAVCSPSRHMIMSGRTVWHLPNSPSALEKGLCPPELEQHTIPAVFNRAGYATMRTCKIGNSYEAANRLFTVRHDATKRGGTDETGSAWHAEQVLDYLAQRQADKDTRPFLIYFGFSHPHDVRDGTPELLEKYGAVNHADPKTLPPPIRKRRRCPSAICPPIPSTTDIRDSATR